MILNHQRKLRASVFTMTPLEYRIVALLRNGHPGREVAQLLDLRPNDARIATAVEKDRMRILISRESYKPTATTTLAKARNRHSTSHLPSVDL